VKGCRTELVLNLKTATALGLTISPSYGGEPACNGVAETRTIIGEWEELFMAGEAMRLAEARAIAGPVGD